MVRIYRCAYRGRCGFGQIDRYCAQIYIIRGISPQIVISAKPCFCPLTVYCLVAWFSPEYSLIRAKFILSPNVLHKIAVRMLLLLSLPVFMYPDEFGGTYSSRILNASILYHFLGNSYHQVINILYWLSDCCNFCHVLSPSS